MKKFLFLIMFFAVLLNASPAFGWGQKGHDVVAYIAECNLKPRVKKKVMENIEGHTLMYYSSWMDNIRDIPEYSMTSTWHYANVNEGETYESMSKEPAGDIITTLDFVIAKLYDYKNLDDSTETLYLKFLVHLIGDLHCPMHAGRQTDRGGNNFKIRWFGSETNLHSLWDSTLIEAVRKWSYTEWQRNIDNFSPAQKQAAASGDYRLWFDETVNTCKEVYAYAEEGANYSYGYMFDNFPLLEQQLRLGGYRLAALLNDIYK